MPEWLRYSLILAMAFWATWYFGKLLWVGFKTGNSIDSRIGVTRSGKPIAFWLSMVLALLFVPSFVWLAVNVAAHLLGLWEFEF